MVEEEVLLFDYILKNPKFGEKTTVSQYARILPGFVDQILGNFDDF